MFGTFSHAPELIILLIIALVFLGPKKLPDLGRGLGQGIKEFRKATTGETDKDAQQAASTSVPASTEAVATPESLKEGAQVKAAGEAKS